MVVMGMASWVVVSRASREREVCSRIPGTPRLPRRAVTSTPDCSVRSMPSDPRRCGEHRAGPAREHGRKPPPLDSQRAVADGVDAAVDHVQSLRADPVVDRRGLDAKRRDLRPRDHSPLRGGDLPDPPPEGWAALTGTIYVDVGHPVSLPRVALAVYTRLHRIT